jgi:SAM-dependent methyltransferase
MQTFRNSSFDLWGRTYDTIKKGMYHWKSTRFAPYLENGSTIYESACGIGMNLYMTLEIMNEVKGIDSLIVHGNEYVDLSVQVANAVFDDSVPFKARKGTICPGDSAHLDFVPSNSFDLVYTGYITPINDPLHLNKGDVNENIKLYREACKGKDWQSIKLTELAQRTQEDFYGRWVEEMTRIAKPDKPVIIEQVSMPVCDEVFDWGGVAKEWWNNVSTHSRYGWDVDPNSIEMEKDTIYRNRYHVFMRKNRLT